VAVTNKGLKNVYSAITTREFFKSDQNCLYQIFRFSSDGSISGLDIWRFHVVHLEDVDQLEPFWKIEVFD